LFGKKTLWGLDIGSGAVKLIGLRTGGKKGALELISAKNVELDRKLSHEDAVFKVLHQVLTDKSIKTGILSTSVAGQSVFVRHITLPRVPDRKMAQIIKYEAQQQVPFPIDDVSWDYQVFSQGDSPEVDVILIAVKKDIVEKLLINITRNKLEVDYVDSTPFALYNAVDSVNTGQEGLIVLDIGCKSTDIIIVENKKMWTRSVPVAGDDITESLASNLGMKFDQAEELKKKNGVVLIGGTVEDENVPQAQEISKAIALVLTDVLTEVSRSISFYKSQYNQAQLNQILILGGSSKIKNIDKFFETNLDLKIADIDLFQDIDTSSQALPGLSLKEDIDVFGVAVGQAAKGMQVSALDVNLLPPEQIKMKEFRKKRGYIFMSGILAILIFITTGFFTLQRNRVDEYQLHTYEIAVKEIDDYKREINAIKNQIKPVQKEIDVLVAVHERRDFWLKVLLEMSTILPLDTWLTSFKPDVVVEGEESVQPERNVGMTEPMYEGRMDFERRPRAAQSAPTDTHRPFPGFNLTVKGETTNTLSSIRELREKLKRSYFFDKVEIIYANYADVVAARNTEVRPSTSRRGRRRGDVPESETEPTRSNGEISQERKVVFSMRMLITEEGEKEVVSD